jgi:aminopeptidase N
VTPDVFSNLTRYEAAERARLLKLECYVVTLDVTTGDRYFTSETMIRFRCAVPGASTFADLKAARVREIVLNGRRLDPSCYDARSGRISLHDLAAQNELRVVAQCRYSRSGQGLHRFTDPADRRVYVHTNFQPFDARQVYACFDQPDLKARFIWNVSVPAGWEVVSNAPCAGNAVLDAGRTRWSFRPTPPLPTYVTMFAAGDFYVAREVYRDGELVIPLGIFCRVSLARYLDTEEILEVTRQGLRFYAEAFALPYPFEKYDQIFVPELNPRAMENAGCVTLYEGYVYRGRVAQAQLEERAGAILHEMAHMWFGNLVTMRWWDDLWLNESFATYMSTACMAGTIHRRSAWAAFAAWWKQWAYQQDDLPTTHPVVADVPDVRSAEVTFDGVTYAKGASVIRQLVAEIGQRVFLGGIRSYLARHAWGNAAFGELLADLSAACGQDMAPWSHQWLQIAGVNTLRPSYVLDGDGRFVEFAVEQQAPDAHPMLRSHRIAIGLYARTDSGLTRELRVDTTVAGERTVVPGLAGVRRPDLVLLNDEDLAYAKIRLDDHSLRTVVSSIGSFTDPLPAALCWGTLWDMCRQAELPGRDYIRLVAEQIGGVTHLPIVQSVLKQATYAAYRYTDPCWREGGLPDLADSLYELVLRADAGSDVQLVIFRAFACVARSARHVDAIAAVYAGRGPIPGLVTDPELHWLLLRHLISCGVAGEDDIAAETARDGTADGQRHAAACRAAIPAAPAKDATWERIVNGSKLSNGILGAMLDGFADPAHPELLTRYVRPYFDELGRIWSTWDEAMAPVFTRGAYPSLVISAATITKTMAYLTECDSPPLRRMLAEGSDDVRRALYAQAKDSSASTLELPLESYGWPPPVIEGPLLAGLL